MRLFLDYAETACLLLLLLFFFLFHFSAGSIRSMRCVIYLAVLIGDSR